MNSLPEQNHQRGRYVTTRSGALFYVDECNIEDIPITDIAHALGMNCRFNGHVDRFYSVAEHSVLVSKLVPEKDALWGLLHDVTEAFVPDMPRPFKDKIIGFDDFEGHLAKHVARHFDLSETMPQSVKYIDRNIVADEARRLYVQPPCWVDSYESVCPADWIVGYQPIIATELFMKRYKELTNARNR